MKEEQAQQQALEVLSQYRRLMGRVCARAGRQAHFVDPIDAYAECRLALLQRLSECPEAGPARDQWVAAVTQNALRTHSRRCRRWHRERTAYVVTGKREADGDEDDSGVGGGEE